jgi:hypothetical protein
MTSHHLVLQQKRERAEQIEKMYEELVKIYSVFEEPLPIETPDYSDLSTRYIHALKSVLSNATSELVRFTNCSFHANTHL